MIVKTTLFMPLTLPLNFLLNLIMAEEVQINLISKVPWITIVVTVSIILISFLASFLGVVISKRLKKQKKVKMNNKINLYKKPIYPLICLISSIIIFIVGLVFAKDEKILWFFLGLSGLYIIFGYWKQLLLATPITIIMILIFGGVTYLVAKELPDTKYAIARVLALMLSVIPNMAINPSDLIRNMKKLKYQKKNWAL